MSDCPPVGSSYVLQVLQIKFPSLEYRNQRELHTLAEVLDRLAAVRDLSVQSRRALATRRRLVASDPPGTAPTQRAALDFSRRGGVSGEGAKRRDAGQALSPGGRTSSQGLGKGRGRGSGAPRPESPQTVRYGENGERCENGGETGNATRRRIARRETGNGAAASKWGPADARRVEWGILECLSSRCEVERFPTKDQSCLCSCLFLISARLFEVLRVPPT